jgi:hypothetical protein
LAQNHADEVVDDGEHRQFLQHTWYRFAVPHLHLHRGLELRQRGFDLPAQLVQRSEVVGTVDRRIEQCGDQSDLAGPEAWPADAVVHLAEYQGLWQGHQRLPGEPRGTGLVFQPHHELVMDTQRCEPTRAWNAFDRRRPPHTRLDQGPTGREVHHLARADAPHSVYAGLGEEGEMRIRTQAPIGHAHVPWVSGRMDRLHLSEIVGEKGRVRQLQEHTGAGMKQPQEPRDRKAAPTSLLRRLAEGTL